MRIGSLFSGYGGLDMAVESVFPESFTGWYSEIAPGACEVLKASLPDVQNLGDIKAVDWSRVTPVDVLTAGFPCQPISTAGLLKGKDDDRWLWPEVARCISILRPGLVLLENVAALVKRGLADCLSDLATLGYDAEWDVVAASDVGAPHQRKRIFVLAWSPYSEDEWGGWSGEHGQPAGEHGYAASARRAPVEDAYGEPGDERGISGPGETSGRDPRPDVGGRAGVDAGFTWPAEYVETIARWERLTRPAPSPVDAKGRLSELFVEWMMGLPGGCVTGLGLSRTKVLTMLGNGVVPQQAEHALRSLLGRKTAGHSLVKV